MWGKETSNRWLKRRAADLPCLRWSEEEERGKRGAGNANDWLSAHRVHKNRGGQHRQDKKDNNHDTTEEIPTQVLVQ